MVPLNNGADQNGTETSAWFGCLSRLVPSVGSFRRLDADATCAETTAKIQLLRLNNGQRHSEPDWLAPQDEFEPRFTAE